MVPELAHLPQCGATESCCGPSEMRMVLVGQSCQGRPQGDAEFEISLKRRERVSGRDKSTKGEMSECGEEQCS